MGMAPRIQEHNLLVLVISLLHFVLLSLLSLKSFSFSVGMNVSSLTERILDRHHWRPVICVSDFEVKGVGMSRSSFFWP